MINKEDNKENDQKEEYSGVVDTAYMDIHCHILIKDKETNEVLVNTRG